METLEERILCLEKRITAIELELKDGRQKLNEIVSTWHDVLINFADNYAIDSEIVEQSKIQKEKIHNSSKNQEKAGK